MQTFFKDYLDILQACHTDILKALDGLPPAALDWISGSEMNSISVMVFHLTGAERYWIGDVAAQEPSDRDRDSEFKVHDVGTDAVRKRLDDSLTYASKTLEKLTLQDLEASRTSPRDGRKFTVAWALLHALEHSNLHLGHIQITRQLWMESKGNI
jgi:uncharacterized damage-inducible protein DinB